MKINWLEIKDFRSIKDSGRIYVDSNITVLAGKNRFWYQVERPSKVAAYSGWDSRRVRISHSPVASLGGCGVTFIFKRRQLDGGPKAKWLKGLSSEIPS
ncbi:hypothetical protein [Sporosarcina highlanderae]|uniref:Uncharacterized protein n=1 Tax=Sporosarcina highlanderae TaxID=3035916 RepID=A0ABT8JSS1_9BACL|nr:hypothetical protein [Sporosarcina highlanderae]MDN4608211.1 hypothetical protein [Sporosarcina highlanderae]